MKYLLILVVALLTACSTPVAVKMPFPEPPGKLSSEPCPDLQKLQVDAKLSDVGKTVAVNYNTYYTCAIKLDSWIEWYAKQKIIYEGVK